MVGRGFAVSVKRQNPAIQILHCCLHKEPRPEVRFQGLHGKINFKGKIFLFLLYVWNNFFLGTTKFGGAMSPVAMGLKETLTIKVLPKELWDTTKDCIQIVNFVTVGAFVFHKLICCFATKCNQNSNHCYFMHLCIAFHKAKVLSRLFKLWPEISKFIVSQNNYHLCKHLEDAHWIAELAYMTDLFEHLNELTWKCEAKMKIH